MVHYQYYLVGKTHQKAVEEIQASHRTFVRKLNKIKKKYGFDRMLINGFGSEKNLVAIGFKAGVTPDPKIWRQRFRGEVNGAYWPKGNSKEGRALLAEFKEVERWDAGALSRSVGHPGILFFNSRVYPFSTNWNKKTKTTVFCVPKLPPEETTPDEWYKPVKGVRPISFKKAQQLMESKSP